MKLPLRKCYHAAKVGLFLLIVVTILALYEQWRGGKRSARAETYDSEDKYEKEILEDEARIIPGLGEGGVAAYLTGEAKRLGEESEKKLAINVYLSDRIAYNRTLKDYRNPACQRVIYDAELPSASVILIFHNEPYSVVIRTIWSVVNSVRRTNPWFAKANDIDRESSRTMTMGYPGQDPSSPFVYLKEIILVDDKSTLPELKGKLSHYVRTRLPPDLIRILRLPQRQGLILARISGARIARGDVLIFLDSHCEVNVDWLRPLLQRISHKRDAVLTPLIDVIDQSTFELEAAQQFQVGGFTFMGHFTWIEVPEREKKRRGSDIAPTWSPTMAGGLFAINRQYYWELGAYDEQMAGWGGENLEMSFRIWQCGGTLETVPCSRVGHVFRAFHPYGLPAHTDTHGINTARMAEVWMDEYAELFYLNRPDLRKSPKIGDVTHRKILREKLKCKSFQWYLDNIYKEKFVPVRDVFGYGRFMNPSSAMCLDTLQREGEATALGLYPCHSRLEPTQHLALSLAGELRDEEKCAEVQYERSPVGSNENVSRRVLMVTCHGKHRGQHWRYLPTQQIQHTESGLCLHSTGISGSDALVMRCRAGGAQVWVIDYSEINDFRMNDNEVPSEQEMKLKKLRGQRRISRSLLSYEDATTRRHHRKKKHKKKNKFILKLVRNETEHLEVDVYCKHARLYPNNSFVRDLVTILNDKDIKVINNGRVFERNKVSDVVNREHSAVTLTTDTVNPYTADTPSDYPQTKPLKKRKRKKHRPVAASPELGDAASNKEEEQAGDQDDLNRPGSKKIIIEDFVEIKPMGALAKHLKKRKRAKKTRSTTGAPRVGDWEDSMRMESSADDSPMVEADGRPDTGRRAPSSSRAPRRSDLLPQNRALNAQAQEPVKLIMKSNVTLKLGDEFFTWTKRGRTADDVADILGELIIPDTAKISLENETKEKETEGVKGNKEESGRRRDSSSSESGQAD
ncbi:polypeptide N-acetylgalactosaminyltransferase 1-like isoform X3 [Danaus plexippus]|uniref:polypeptide N-acetylgalactosaminyltransferase 1-like isoform X3 n=1 Tax=Danaus plexippus TaxID=13037 RepID=UPI002AB095F0|nr:polypeptide N-acetylgalactosaminyltransferase 1-like isoform X3 [Danaus plexippus]